MPKQRNKVVSLSVTEPNAAGMDIGATEIFVATPADHDSESVRCSVFHDLHYRFGKTGGLASIGGEFAGSRAAESHKSGIWY